MTEERQVTHHETVPLAKEKNSSWEIADYAARLWMGASIAIQKELHCSSNLVPL